MQWVLSQSNFPTRDHQNIFNLILTKKLTWQLHYIIVVCVFLQGGSASGVSLTAYVLIALLENENLSPVSLVC